MELKITIPLAWPTICKIGLGVVYFFFLYSVSFVFVPAGLGTRALIGLVGVVALVWSQLKSYSRQKRFVLSGQWFGVVCAVVGFGAWALFSSLFGGTSDYLLAKYSVSIFLMIAGAYWVIRLTQHLYGERTEWFSIVSRYVISVVLVQVLLALSMFVNPALRTALQSVQNEVVSFDLIETLSQFRITGFGCNFFDAGYTNAFALVLIGANFRLKDRGAFPTWFTVVAFLIITAIGSMMARTTLVGSVLCVLLVVYRSRIFSLRLSRRLRTVWWTLVVLTVGVVAVYQVLDDDTRVLIDASTEYGFEMFYNYVEEGELSTESSDELKNMYEVYPTTFGTWLIGDGRFVDPHFPGSYYMGIDVGYLRLLFGVGLVGCFLYFLYFFLLVRMMYRHSDRSLFLIYAVFYLLFLVINIKGFADFTLFFCLFAMALSIKPVSVVDR